MIAACLCEVAPRGDTELDAQVLEQDRHQIGDHDDGQQRIAKPGATGQIRGPIARVHVSHCDQKSGAGECRQFPPERRRARDDNASVDFRERDLAGASTPPSIRLHSRDVVRFAHKFTLFFLELG